MLHLRALPMAAWEHPFMGGMYRCLSCQAIESCITDTYVGPIGDFEGTAAPSDRPSVRAKGTGPRSYGDRFKLFDLPEWG